MDQSFRLLREIVQDRHSWFFVALLCCVFAWGHDGKAEWISFFYPSWNGIGNARDSASTGQFGLVWDQELIGFLIGFFLVVIVPACLVRWLLGARLSEFGFGWPSAKDRKTAVVHAGVIAVITVPSFYLAAFYPSIRAYYPYYHGDPSSMDFVAYEITTSLFYISIEGLFRGFLLFGIIHWLRSLDGSNSTSREPMFGCVAVVLSLLPYALWHLGKAPAEVWGTLFWGLVAGISAVSTRTIWHLIVLHWLLNVFMDYVILLDQQM